MRTLARTFIWILILAHSILDSGTDMTSPAVPTPAPSDPASCFSFDIFSDNGIGIDVPCLVTIVVAGLLIVVSVAVAIYFFVMVVVRGTPKRIAQKREIALQEASLEATAIVMQMGIDPTTGLRLRRTLCGTCRRNPRFMGACMWWLLLCLAMQTEGQVTITNIQAQIPCNATRLLCGGRQEQALSFDVSFNVPVTSLVGHEEKWMVVPFSVLDRAPGFQYCQSGSGSFEQCFLVNNGSGVDVSVEVGSFRLAYLLDPLPDYTFPANYSLHTTDNTGSVCNATVDPSTVYYDETGCVAADCVCPGGNYSQVMYPLLPQCGLFAFRTPFPRPAAWLRVNVTFPGIVHSAVLPIATAGQLAFSGGYGMSLEVVEFENAPRGKFPLPRLDGGIVVCDWPTKIDATYAAEDWGRANPGLTPGAEGWYYVNSSQRLDHYQNGVCGQNGVTSAQIYADDALCCTSGTNFSTGACIPDPTPAYILQNTTSYLPPPPGGTVANAYWPCVDPQSRLHLLREVQEFELVDGVRPRMTIRATMRDTMASINTRRVLPGIELRLPECRYFHPDNIGVLQAHICNAATHRALLPLDTLTAHVECSGEDAANATFFTKLLTLRRVFNTGRCEQIFFHYNFSRVPFQFNVTNQIARYVDFFQLNCRVNATLQFENMALPVLMHVLEEVRCIAVVRNSTQPAYYVGTASDIKDAPKPPCKTDGDILCQIDQGTLASSWFGPFFLTFTILFFLFCVTFFPLYTVKLERERLRIAGRHKIDYPNRMPPTMAAKPKTL